MNNQNSWVSKSIFYHIYPLGLCDAPTSTEAWGQPVERLNKIYDWIPTIKDLGCNALYLGPLFESSTHGYDTADYYHVDKRLGTNLTLQKLSRELHQNGIKIVLDGVFNHVGRDFWAFRDLLANQESSRYRDWFSGIDFNKSSPFGDKFSYDCWSGYYSLVKLNLRNEEVKRHIFGAIEMWINDFGIDGLRLDVAEVMDKDFLAELANFCRKKKLDFWLMGEMIHGNYNQLANERMLDSTTNYEAYKGLYSSHNDANYFEIAYTFNRQFGEYGVYKGLQLYNFADNHDVSRVASSLQNEAHLLPLYALLYGMPGIPSIYYGSERGLGGIKGKDDAVLRPSLEILPSHKTPPIYQYIQKLAAVRHASLALQVGKYKELYLSHQQFVFLRFTDSSFAVVAVNAAATNISIRISLNLPDGMMLKDSLDASKVIVVNQSCATLEIPAFGACIFTN